ncbi:MAG: mucoidy inhibitor MuiA family protein [bacterium]
MSSPRLITLPIRRVTVFEDRAEVVREIELDLPAGRSEVLAEDLSPLLSDAHLTAQLAEAVPGVHVEDVRFERALRTETAPAERRAGLLASLDDAERALAHAERAFARARQRRDAALLLLKRYAGQAAKALWMPGGADGWREGLTRLEEALEAAERGVAAAESERARAAEDHRRQAALVRDAEDRRVRLRASLSVRFSADAAARVRLQVVALTPCALWRPAHEARLGPDGQLEWETFATVWQRTGEDWDGVALTLSTDRPGSGARLPSLAPDELRLQQKAVRRRVVLSHREQAARKDDEGAMPGVYDGGEARAFAVTDPVQIPSDGRPYRVATGRFSAPAQLGLVARPEVSPQVCWLARTHNASATPLLAGPVTLVRDGAYVGVGDLDYVAPGDRFELSFGSDDRWRLTARRSRETEDRLLGRDRLHFVTHVELRYAGAEPAEAEVYLRLPVSELDQLKVVPSKTFCSEGIPRPDADGRVCIPVRLAGGERRELSLGFTFETSGDVVLPDPW